MRFNAALPAGMKIDKHVFRQADFIERALDNLRAALRDGAILVVIVVMSVPHECPRRTA